MSNIHHHADIIAAANAALALPRDTGGENPANVICAANLSRFDQSHLSVPLTTYAVGWRDPSQLDALLDFLAPEVPNTPERFSYRTWDNADAFLADAGGVPGGEDIRPVGSDFKKVEWQSAEVHDRIENKGLAITVETRDLLQNTGRREQIVERLLRRVIRNDYLRAYTLLAAAAVNTAKTWGATSDPDGDVLGEIKASADATGVRPSRAFLGDNAALKRLLAFRAQNNAGATASASLSEQQLGSLYRADTRVGDARYQATSAAKAVVGDNAVLLFSASGGLAAEDPSNIKRFTCPCDDGTRYRVYEEQVGPKLTTITVEHYSAIRVTSPLGIRSLTIA